MRVDGCLSWIGGSIGLTGGGEIDLASERRGDSGMGLSKTEGAGEFGVALRGVSALRRAYTDAG